MEKMVLVVVKEWFAQFTEKLPWNCFRFPLLYLTDPLNVFQPLNTKNNSYFNQNKTWNKNTHNFFDMGDSLLHISLNIFWQIWRAYCYLIHDSNVFSFPGYIINPNMMKCNKLDNKLFSNLLVNSLRPFDSIE